MKARLEPRINLVGRTPLETVIPLATPFIVFVDPASSCNFKCTFCPTGHRDMIAETGRFQGVMKLEIFQKIIDDFRFTFGNVDTADPNVKPSSIMTNRFIDPKIGL